MSDNNQCEELRELHSMTVKKTRLGKAEQLSGVLPPGRLWRPFMQRQPSRSASTKDTRPGKGRRASGLGRLCSPLLYVGGIFAEGNGSSVAAWKVSHCQTTVICSFVQAWRFQRIFITFWCT